jgi:hypothetical protein
MSWANEFQQAVKEQAMQPIGAKSKLIKIQEAKVKDLVEALSTVLKTPEDWRPINPLALADCLLQYCPRELRRPTTGSTLPKIVQKYILAILY